MTRVFGLSSLVDSAPSDPKFTCRLEHSKARSAPRAGIRVLFRRSAAAISSAPAGPAAWGWNPFVIVKSSTRPKIAASRHRAYSQDSIEPERTGAEAVAVRTGLAASSKAPITARAARGKSARVHRLRAARQDGRRSIAQRKRCALQRVREPGLSREAPDRSDAAPRSSRVRARACADRERRYRWRSACRWCERCRPASTADPGARSKIDRAANRDCARRRNRRCERLVRHSGRRQSKVQCFSCVRP